MRRGKRHRYYVSHRLITKRGEAEPGGWRLPAATIESAVARLITEAFKSSHLIRNAPPECLESLSAAIQNLKDKLAGDNRGQMLNELVESGRIAPGQLTVKLNATTVAAQLSVTSDQIDPDALSMNGAFTLRRRGVESKLVLDDAPTTIDPLLVKSIATGRAWFEEIKAGTSMQKIATRENISQRRVAHLVDLGFLAPDIVQMITDGRQPTSLTADKLIRTNKPSLWIDQRAWLAGT